MDPSIESAISATFFDRLRSSTSSALLLDYDGTLAPFHVDRDQAYPYPGVLPILERILDTGRSRVVLVTGRAVADLQPLVEPLRDVEVWGSHGMEHLSASGLYTQTDISETTAAALAEAGYRLIAAGLRSKAEIKPGGIAVHWRGLSEAAAKEIHITAHNCLRPFMSDPGLKLLEFDGGVELRVAHPNKGDAVMAILNECSPDACLAYLGDDHTDEAAFRALNGRGATVLVRDEYRTTKAKFWIQPPGELIRFLDRWLNCLG